MKRFINKVLFIFFGSSLLLLSGGCNNGASDAWENTKTAMRYFNRSGKFWVRGDQDSRQVATSEAFYGPEDEEFIPLKDGDIQSGYADFSVPQPRDIPGDSGGRIPGIEGFHKPSASLASVFKRVYFNTDDHVLRSKEYQDMVARMGEYLKKHPGTYIFVEGHCDARASEAYNLALGTRRSNFVRSILIKHGASPQQVYTISYGKERPADIGHNAHAWKMNRRVEFKIYDQTAKIKTGNN